jgi:uncharacterized protein (TIGR00645 family)
MRLESQLGRGAARFPGPHRAHRRHAPDMDPKRETAFERRQTSILGSLIFASRWLQVPLYLGLIVAQGVYVALFLEELWHLVGILWDPGALDHTVERLGIAERSKETVIMLVVLSLIDVVMISNLLIMVIVGGYETFVSRLRLEGHPDQPEWLSHVNANVLKVKLATAIIGISSIHLLKVFISAGTLPERTILWQTVIHVVFLFSAVAIAIIDRIMAGTARPAKGDAAAR